MYVGTVVVARTGPVRRANTGLSLPLFPAMADRDVNRVADGLREALRGN